jgi:NADP-dependent 3-hydroxy acid dehydrogenase YdfG
MTRGIRDKVIVLTGASSGTGRSERHLGRLREQ